MLIKKELNFVKKIFLLFITWVFLLLFLLLIIIYTEGVILYDNLVIKISFLFLSVIILKKNIKEKIIEKIL